MDVTLIGNSLVRGLDDSRGRWKIECYPGSTLDRMMDLVEERASEGGVVVLLVGVPDLQGGRGGIWLRGELKRLMEEYERLVPCTFWPPTDADEGLVAEVVATNWLIREGNAKRGWGTPYLEGGILVREEGEYVVREWKLADGLHPTEREKRGMRVRMGEWYEPMEQLGKLEARGMEKGESRGDRLVMAEENSGEEDGVLKVMVTEEEEAEFGDEDGSEERREEDQFERGEDSEEAEGDEEEEEVAGDVEELRRRRDRRGAEVGEQLRGLDLQMRQIERRKLQIMEEWAKESGEMGEEIGRIMERGRRRAGTEGDPKRKKRRREYE